MSKSAKNKDINSLSDEFLSHLNQFTSGEVSGSIATPGEFLQEILDAQGMSQAELAHRMGRPVQVVNEIIKGTKLITPETAIQLEEVTNVKSLVWMIIEHRHQLAKSKDQENVNLEEESKLVDTELYNELVKLGKLPKTPNRVEKAKELRKFLRVASFGNLEQVGVYQAAYRVAGKPSPIALAAWLRLGETLALDIQSEPYNKDMLKKSLPSLRKMTLLKPEEFSPQLLSLLADCGIALVILPHLPKTYANGATFWQQSDRVVVMVTIRNSYADIFWFSLIHEIGHVLLHGKRETNITIKDGVYSDDKMKQREFEADRFASDLLIPSNEYREFAMNNHFTESSVRNFASKIEVSPGVVVGRLQHDGHISYGYLNDLREKYIWGSSD
jgi:HTH-type transcriptional regulator / antitoxin HigA